MGHLHRNIVRLAGKNRDALLAHGVAPEEAKRVARDCPKGENVVDFFERAKRVAEPVATAPVKRTRKTRVKAKAKKKAARRAA